MAKTNKSPLLWFGDFTPDLPTLNNPGSNLIYNVLPASLSYRPMPGLTVFSGALGARCQGAYAATDSAGNVANFAGTATKLYLLAADTTWGDVSGATYTTPSDALWKFTQYSNRVIATNFTDAVQNYRVGVDAVFSNLFTAFKARYVAVVRSFVMYANTDNDPQECRWTADDDPTGTTLATNLADRRILGGEGGWNQAIVGGQFAIVVQERAVWRGDFGGNAVFLFNMIDQKRGTPAPSSVINFGQRTFFLGDDDFYMTDGTAESQPIGYAKIAKTFYADLDQSFTNRITAAVDPINKVAWWAYPGAGNTAGAPNKCLVYHWPSGKWATGDLAVEILFTSLSQGYTADNVDGIFATADSTDLSADSRIFTGGKVLLSAFDLNHKLNTFTGANLQATLETTEGQIYPMNRAFVQSVRPQVDVSSATIAVASRERIADSAVYGSAVAMNTQGECPQRNSGRYHRAKMVIPAGASWTHAMGVEFQAVADGVR